MAAWVQAVGSIAAIVAAGVIASWQMRASEKARINEQGDKQQAAFAVIQIAAGLAKTLGDFASKDPADFSFITQWKFVYQGQFDAAFSSLKAINAHELGRKELVVEFFNIVGALQAMNTRTEAYMLDKPSMEKTLEIYNFLITQGVLANHAWLRFDTAAKSL